MHYPDHIKGFTSRLSGVVIENKAAIALIEQHDTPETLFYVDPPYPHSTRNMNRGNAAYAIEMTDSQHRELAHCLKSVKGMVMLSGYACPLYAELFSDWKSTECSHFADGARKRTEVLWFNPQALRASQESLYLA
jgi:DNA adenine methylase